MVIVSEIYNGKETEIRYNTSKLYLSKQGIKIFVILSALLWLTERLHNEQKGGR